MLKCTELLLCLWLLDISVKLTLREKGVKVFQNRVCRKIFDHKREKVIEDWRKLHNEELHDSYYSTEIIQLIKSWRTRWTGDVTCMHTGQET